MITLARAINKINEYTFEVPKRQSIFTKVKWFQRAKFWQVVHSCTDSDGILEGEPDFKNLSIKGLDLFLEFVQLLIFLLSAGLVIILTMVGQLIDLERIVEVLREFSLFFKALDVASADLEAVVSDAGRL